MLNKNIFINEKIIIELYLLCEKLNRPVSCKDLPTNEIPFSYNTLLRKGIKFKELNFTEHLFLKENKKCINCNKPIIFTKDYKDKKFCNHSCATKYNNTIYIKRQSAYENKSCGWCNKDIGRVLNNYCSRKCLSKHNYMNKFTDWWFKTGIINKTEILKSFLILIDGYKCAECGINEYLNQKIVLQLEHKDGNANNNDYSNLSLLCPNCHSQTPTYKGRNIGNGKRIKRNERYKQGKSY